MSGTTDIPRLVAAVRDQRPGIAIDVVELWDNDLGAALVAGDIDIAIGWHLSISGELARHVLRREPYAVVLAEGHRLAHRDALALSDLRSATFRFLPRRFAAHYYDAVLAALRSTGEDFHVWENPLPGLRYFGDLATGGFNLLPLSISRSLPAGVRCIPVTDRLPPVELEMVWRPGTGRAVEAVAAMATKLVGVAPGA
jgi:DNA-binding transcriptional LysR family regulator